MTADAGVTRRDKKSRLAGDRCEKHTGRQSYEPGKEVESGCYREVVRQRPILMGGVRRKEEIKKS